MTEKSETCPGCGRLTREGERQWRARQRPIYGTDISRPASELIADIRNQLTRVRGQLHDIGFHIGWRDRLQAVEGLLTCGISALYNTLEEMNRCEAQHPEPAEPAAAE